MTAAARPISMARLKRRALSIGAAKAFDHAMQFLLPVVLVRCLDAATFGEYRLLWLAIGTLLAVATLNMPQGLFYYLPRSDAPTRRLYVHQTLLYLAASGLVCAWLVSPWNPWLPQTLEPLDKYQPLVPVFVALWITACLLDFLPPQEERVAWGVWVTIGLAALRTALLALGAFATGELAVLLWLLLALVVVKLALLAAYIARWHGLRGRWLDPGLFAAQLRHCAPFGLSSALYSLRLQGDQWIAAALFALHSFAAFSVAAVLNQVIVIFRRSVFEAFLPSMSRIHARGDAAGMLELNSRANVMVGTLLYPLLAFVFVFAEDLVTLVYTATYIDAAPVMRIYVAGLAALVIEVGSVVLLLQQGAFALRLNIALLVLALAASWLAARHFGLAGAAAGSVAAIFIDRWFLIRHVARQTGVAVARLQDWRGLGFAALFAGAAAGIAWAVNAWAGLDGALGRLGLGAAVTAAAYAPWLMIAARRAP
jgi:O-antigen/teichoic acid export membrane protein